MSLHDLLLGLVLGSWVLACGALDSEGETDQIPLDPGPLAEATAWAPSGPDRDPFADHRPAEVRCPEAAWGVEGQSLEVTTGVCVYFSVEQPLLRDVPAGATIEITLWHQPLHAESEATGHVALAVGDAILWDIEVAIPGPADVHLARVTAPRDLHAGEAMIFHLHNHGANSWNLGAVHLAAPEG